MRLVLPFACNKFVAVVDPVLFLLLLLLLHLLLHRVLPTMLITASTAPLVSVLAHLGIQAQVPIPQHPAAVDIALHLTPVHRAIIMSSQPAV